MGFPARGHRDPRLLEAGLGVQGCDPRCCGVRARWLGAGLASHLLGRELQEAAQRQVGQQRQGGTEEAQGPGGHSPQEGGLQQAPGEGSLLPPRQAGAVSPQGSEAVGTEHQGTAAERPPRVACAHLKGHPRGHHRACAPQSPGPRGTWRPSAWLRHGLLGLGLRTRWQRRAQAGAGHTTRAGSPSTQCCLHTLVGQESRREPGNVGHGHEGDEVRQTDKHLWGETG